jgi:hypothetical protein
MSVFNTQSIIPNHSGLLELPAGAVSGAAPVEPVGPSAREIVESVLIGPDPQDDILSLAQEIEVEAYLLFEARGFEHGHDVEDWLAAEDLVRQRRMGIVEAIVDPRN